MLHISRCHPHPSRSFLEAEEESICHLPISISANLLTIDVSYSSLTFYCRHSCTIALSPPLSFADPTSTVSNESWLSPAGKMAKEDTC